MPREAADAAQPSWPRREPLHSGHIGDYVAWWTAGAGMLGGVCLVALR